MFATWARGYVRRTEGRRAVTKEAVVTLLWLVYKNGLSVPFVGLAERMVLAAFPSLPDSSETPAGCGLATEGVIGDPCVRGVRVAGASGWVLAPA